MNYDQLEYDPSTKGPLAERYDDVAKYSEFCGKLGDNLLRFAILYFDENSPFYKNSDLEDKKNKCYEALKSDMETRKAVESMSKEYKAVALRWFKLHHSYTFELWWARKLDFHQNSQYLATDLSSLLKEEDVARAIQRKELIKKNMDSDMSALLGLENTLFNNEKTKKLITKAVNEASLSGYAEAYSVNFFDELQENS